MSSKRLLAGILASISPSSKELKEEAAFSRKMLSSIRPHLPNKAKVKITGSVAKGTFLKDSRDLDIFVLLPLSVKPSKLESIIKRISSKVFPHSKKEIGYAEHPYVRIYSEGRKIDLVPAYDISSASQMLSSVDRSVLHLGYVMRNLPKRSRGQVLLLKKFLKSNGLYGAEIRVEGFSGYLCELLIIKYGSFLGAVRAISRWSQPVFIDLKKHYLGKAGLVGKKFEGASLVVVDPVDSNRNVSAIVSEQNFKRLVSLAKKFLKNPSERFFENSEADFSMKRVSSFLKSKGIIYELSFQRPHIVDDILWGQLKRFGKNLCNSLEKLDFSVSGLLIDSTQDVCRIFLRFKTSRLPDSILVKGPPLDLEKNVLAFKRAHKNSRFRIKEGSVFAVCKRQLRNLDDALAYVKDQKQLFPSHISSNIIIKKL